MKALAAILSLAIASPVFSAGAAEAPDDGQRLTPGRPYSAVNAGGSRQAASAKPNVVLFLSDDHGWRDAGCYGNPDVRTPHIDRLAAEGMRFTGAYAASPLCSPSRCVIETGLMPHRNGAHQFNASMKPGTKTLPVYFRELGYHTAEIGKFHHYPNQAFPYDYVHADERKAADFISAYDGRKPLLLVVCPHDPHQPWAKNRGYDPARLTLPPNFVDTPQARADLADYYTDVENMDAILGATLQALEARGMRENTLFLYTTDQGASWPFAKWCVYDAGLRVPLIARWPGRVAAGSTSEARVSLADLVPTFLEASGSPPRPDLDGRSFLGVLTGATHAHRDVIFGTHTGNEGKPPSLANHNPARTVIAGNLQYILNLAPERTFTTWVTAPAAASKSQYQPFWPTWVERAKTDPAAAAIVNAYLHRPREELYDLEADPYEMRNLAGDLRLAADLSRLRERLAEWCHLQGDTEALKWLKP